MKVPAVTKALGVATLFATSVSVSAVAILSNQAVAPDGAPPPSYGLPVLSIGASPAQELADVSGFVWKAKVESKVYENYPGNTLGGYTFEYNIANTGGSAFSGAISAFILGFGSVPGLDVQYLTGTGTIPRGAYLDATGELLTWFWSFSNDPGLNSGFGATPSESSATLVMHTPYKDASLTKAIVYGGGTAQLFDVYVPVPVPEPSTYAAMFGLGLLGFAAYRRFQA